MPDTPVAPGSPGPYPSDMETRVAVLETLAQQTHMTLQAIREDIRDLRREVLGQGAELRREMAAQGAELRREMVAQGSELRREMVAQGAELRREMAHQGSELRGEMTELRRIHDRDFRLTFGAIIATAIGLAALIARVAHWL